MSALETYLTDLRTLQDAGTDETAGYPAFKALVDSVGEGLKPKVLCLIHPAGVGAGIPDAAFFTTDQIDKKTKALKPDQLPSAGIAEIKAPGASLDKVLASVQFTKYLDRYGQVLVTNYHEFRLAVRTPEGEFRLAERLSLAGSAAEFRELTKHPKKGAEQHGKRVEEFLTRCLRNSAILTDPKDVAWFLASHARDALDQLARNDANSLDALASVRKSFEQALGLTFTGDEGDHFFRSSLVQTLFYGIFSAWVLWARDPHRKAKDRFDWKTAIWTLRVPMISALFQQIATPTQLGKLHLTPVLENTGDLLNRVDRAAFFKKFQDAEAVQYFYEPFLEEFDPGLRKELGVWYTPREVVKYMVARVDTVLREELGIKRGLADEQVVVLDPCCGTGAFLLEVLDRIGKTLKEEGGDALTASDLRKAATERLFGFELLPAPFVVSHLQLGLQLQRLGAPLRENDRAGVYLTNALTGWLRDETAHLPFPELEQERELAEEVKQQKKVLVILGNPPYNGYAGTTESDEERGLTEAYKKVRKVAKPQGQGLNDLYVRFYRMAERKIVEGTGRGVICFISNCSWLDGLSFTGMRERFLEEFDSIWIDNLNGDKYKTGKQTPDGKPDPSIFSTDKEPVGIQVGTAIGTLVRKETGKHLASVAFRDLWGTDKREQLMKESALPSKKVPSLYKPLLPALPLGMPLLPALTSLAYTDWPRLTDLMPTSFPGVKTSRDDVVVDIDRSTLEKRMQHYCDSNVSHDQITRDLPAAMEGSSSFSAHKVRASLLRTGFKKSTIRRYLYKPFDLRWLYWEAESGLLDRPRPEYVAELDKDTPWLEARQKFSGEDFDRGFVTTSLADNLGNGLSNYFPLYLNGSAEHTLFTTGAAKGSHANLSGDALAYLSTMGAANERTLFHHIVAILHSPAYRKENAGGLRQDWPRVPLPSSRKAYDKSHALGWLVRLLIDPETEGAVEQADYPSAFAKLGVLTGTKRGQLDPSKGDLALEAGWGHHGKGGIVMPATGKLTDHGATVDIHLNDRAYWANVPKPVWEYTLGGYQVIKKWLSYREKKILGRDLTVEEARYVTEMIQRIAAILALGPELDKNYEACKKETYSWK